MSRLGDLENAIVNRVAAATISGAPAFATVRGFSGGDRPVLREAIRRERMPAAFVCFTYEPISPETFDYNRGPQFKVFVVAQLLRSGTNPRHGDATARGAFALIDSVRGQLDWHEPDGDTQLQCLYGRFIDADDRHVIYELGYRAWPIFLSEIIAGDPAFAGPRVIGSVSDFIRLDPAAGEYILAGTARPMNRLPIPSATTNVGTAISTQLVTNADADSNIAAVQVGAATTGGWRSLNFIIADWCDVSEAAEVIVLLQATGAASGNAALQVDWDVARDGSNGIVESGAANTVAVPANAGDIVAALAGTIPAGTFENGDCVNIAVQRIGGDAADTYPSDVLLARAGWINFRRNRL